ncbi:MAG: membrane protein insertion efficiency factor YidD [Deltaproteobacteria bacterium]|nr:membrane protein insertion efficiency factor YidD [Deltaproteobacteria bacterium]
MALLRRGIIIALTGYRRFLSPVLPRACRFFPSCSAYMCEAVERYGILKGIGLGLSRLGRCHPWHPGGFDPVR